MRYNRLGNTGLFVSELSIGTMNFGASGPYAPMGTVEQPEAEKLLARGFEAGINLVDCSDTYSTGVSEEITGRALKATGAKRDEVLIATKVFGTMGPKPNQGGLSRAHILDSAKASLQRLRLDTIDLYQFHGFDPATPIEESLQAMTDLVRLGLVRYIGVSNCAAWQISHALGVARHHGLAKYASVQAFYSLAARDVEREIIPMAAAEGLGLLVWSPLAGGLLGGKFGRGKQGGEENRRTTLPFPPVDMDRAHSVIDALETLAQTKNTSVAQIALAWLLGRPRVASILVGARRLEQLEDNLGATSITFTEDELETLDEASKLPREYPGWMIAMWSQTRTEQLRNSRL